MEQDKMMHGTRAALINAVFIPNIVYGSRKYSAPISATSQSGGTLAVIPRRFATKKELMKKIALIVLLYFFVNNSYSQTFCLASFELPKVKTTKISSRKKINFVLDSLRNKIFSDTLKFDAKDLSLSLSNNETKNDKGYSALYNIEGYSYKLDIINGKLVKDFVNEILVSSKIKKIYIVNKSDAENLFGQQNGMIYIVLKNRKKVNFNVAALNKTEKPVLLNNFHQLKNEEIRFD